MVDLIGEAATPLRAQPLAWLAVVLIVAAMAATALRRPTRRAAAVSGLVLVAAVALYAATLLAREQAVDAVAEVLRRATTLSGESPSTPVREWEYHPWVRRRFRFEYGFWIAMATMFVLGLVNAARAVPAPRVRAAGWRVRRGG